MIITLVRDSDWSDPANRGHIWEDGDVVRLTKQCGHMSGMEGTIEGEDRSAMIVRIGEHTHIVYENKLEPIWGTKITGYQECWREGSQRDGFYITFGPIMPISCPIPNLPRALQL